MPEKLPGPHDRRMWRKLVAASHPDKGGDEELFVWVNQVLKPQTRGGTPNLQIGDDPEMFAKRFEQSTGMTVPSGFWDFVNEKGGV